jgi:hypothetical protein
MSKASDTIKTEHPAGMSKPLDGASRAQQPEQHWLPFLSPTCIALLTTLSLNLVCWLLFAWLITTVMALMS